MAKALNFICMFSFMTCDDYAVVVGVTQALYQNAKLEKRERKERTKKLRYSCIKQYNILYKTKTHIFPIISVKSIDAGWLLFSRPGGRKLFNYSISPGFLCARVKLN